jgi:RNA recognition motif-containing protein
LRIENKDVFIDLKSNKGGMYLKISERKDGNRNSILVPASGIMRLTETLLELAKKAELKGTSRQQQGVSPLRQESDDDIERKSRSCYIGNLSWECNEEQLTAWCSGAGAVVSSVVLRRGKRSTGSGLVEFADVASAQNAVATLNDTEMDGRVILVREDRVAAAQPERTAKERAPKEERKERKAKYSDMDASEKVVEPNKVFVQNLTWETTEEELVAAFCPVGDVASVEIRQTRSGRSLGCGVVEFSSPQAALDAIASLNGEDLNGRELLIREYYQ